MNASYEAREGYLYVTVAGEFTPSAAQDIILEWIALARWQALNRVLVDITLVRGFDVYQIPTITRFDLGAFVAKMLPRHFILAVLETLEQLEKNHFGENVMVNRGINVKLTSSLNEALEWLGVTPKSDGETKHIREEQSAQSREARKPHGQQ